MTSQNLHLNHRCFFILRIPCVLVLKTPLTDFLESELCGLASDDGPVGSVVGVDMLGVDSASLLLSSTFEDEDTDVDVTDWGFTLGSSDLFL